MTISFLSLLVQSKVLLRWYNAQSIRVAHTSSPALNANNGITLAQNTELNSVHDTPLQTAVNVLLPWLRLEVWLLLREVEWIDTTVEMGVLQLSVINTEKFV